MRLGTPESHFSSLKLLAEGVDTCPDPEPRLSRSRQILDCHSHELGIFDWGQPVIALGAHQRPNVARLMVMIDEGLCERLPAASAKATLGFDHGKPALNGQSIPGESVSEPPVWTIGAEAVENAAGDAFLTSRPPSVSHYGRSAEAFDRLHDFAGATNLVPTFWLWKDLDALFPKGNCPVSTDPALCRNPESVTRIDVELREALTHVAEGADLHMHTLAWGGRR